MEGSDIENDEAPEAEGAQGEESGRPKSAPTPWPNVDPDAIEHKSFIVAGDVVGGQVAITVSDGEVTKHGTPDDLFAKLVAAVGNAIAGVGSLLARPLVIRAEAFASITVVFGEAVEDRPQLEIPVYPPVWSAGALIARLMQLEGDELFEAARAVGTGAAAYVELTRLVESEGVTLEWEIRGAQPQRLDPDRAGRQYRRLTPPPKLRDREMKIDGLLYRVIYDGNGQGRAGIRLSKASSRPPRRRGRLVIVRYESQDVAEEIIHRLIGESVVAKVVITESTPGTSIVTPEIPYPLVMRIEAGGHYDPDELFDEAELRDAI